MARNYRCRFGEIDLVMRDGGCLVFCEVRFREQAAHGGSSASVDRAKQRRISRTAAHFLRRHRELADRPCRFDVVAIDGPPRQPEVHWIRGAFDAPQP